VLILTKATLEATLEAKVQLADEAIAKAEQSEAAADQQ